MVTRRAWWAGTLLVVLAGTGCGRGPVGEVSEGCASGDQVPAAVRNALEEAARTTMDRARKGEWEKIYTETAQAVRTLHTQEAFATPMARTLREMGLPSDLHTTSVSVIRFGPGFPVVSRLECAEPGKDGPTTLLLTEFPVQASLVQRGSLGPEQVWVSTLWHGEDGKWRLAGFFAKPATLLGKDSQAFETQAAAEHEAKRNRNAALLYNVAIDLVVPNSWTKPSEVTRLQEKQSHISVSALPKGAPEGWPAPPDTFRVHQIDYGIAQGALCVVLRYEVTAALADTAAQGAYAEKLSRYVQTNFPEYPEAFRFLYLVAFSPDNPNRTWNRLVPLRRPT